MRKTCRCMLEGMVSRPAPANQNSQNMHTNLDVHEVLEHLHVTLAGRQVHCRPEDSLSKRESLPALAGSGPSAQACAALHVQQRKQQQCLGYTSRTYSRMAHRHVRLHVKDYLPS